VPNGTGDGRVVYHALGGGHGHVARGLAVLEALGHGLLVGPPGWESRAASCGVSYAAAPVADGLPAVRRFLDALPVPHLRLVDVFPRGPADELREVIGTAPAWLVARTVRPARYLSRADELAAFEQVAWCEARPAWAAGLHPCQREVGPVLRRTASIAREEARRLLGLADGQRCVLAIGAGSTELQATTRRMLARATGLLGAALRFVGQGGVRAWPAAPLLAGADVAVIAGGYQAVHEVRACGVPAVMIPQPRPWDDQEHRAEVARAPHRRVARSPDELLDALRGLLEGPVRGEPERLEDGAARLAALVERRVEAGVLGEEEIAPMA
jgi:hypothetical protein